MIQRLRKIIAYITATILMLITLGKVDLNRTGLSTVADDSDSKRSTATRKIGGEKSSDPAKVEKRPR